MLDIAISTNTHSNFKMLAIDYTLPNTKISLQKPAKKCYMIIIKIGRNPEINNNLVGWRPGIQVYSPWLVDN